MSRRPFQVMAKPTGARCNLDCRYCYYRSKADLYSGELLRMPTAVLTEYLSQVIASDRSGRPTFVWQGGEPTLAGMGFFRQAFLLAERLAQPGQRVAHSFQTNGTLLNDSWCKLLKSYDVLLGISVDGPRSLHDTYRVDSGGKPSFDRVMRGVWLARNHGLRFNVLCTVNATNAEHSLEVYRFLRDTCGARFLQFIPIVERSAATTAPGTQVTDRSVGPEQWGRFLVEVFDEWVRHDVGKVFVQTFEAAFAAWIGSPSPLCVFARTCGDALALEHNGDVYSCDHFVDRRHLLGNILEDRLCDLASCGAQQRFGEAKLTALPQTCLDCDVRFACHGECPKNRFISATDSTGPLNYLCNGYRHFFHHIDGSMRLMTRLRRSGMPAGDVMQVFRRAPRNDPCPCGSGRKAKHCHGS